MCDGSKNCFAKSKYYVKAFYQDGTFFNWFKFCISCLKEYREDHSSDNKKAQVVPKNLDLRETMILNAVGATLAKVFIYDVREAYEL